MVHYSKQDASSSADRKAFGRKLSQGGTEQVFDAPLLHHGVQVGYIHGTGKKTGCVHFLRHSFYLETTVTCTTITCTTITCTTITCTTITCTSIHELLLMNCYYIYDYITCTTINQIN